MVSHPFLSWDLWLSEIPVSFQHLCFSQEEASSLLELGDLVQ